MALPGQARYAPLRRALDQAAAGDIADTCLRGVEVWQQSFDRPAGTLGRRDADAEPDIRH
ncbi:hypothetical protein ACFQO7_34125 [Catellatospora aurea]|uniref:Uncharacterized protein n=1 Tax=Catellatospora aurea TaxID=1337874 RepID=A0ABW2H6Z2_9ACTN